MFADPEVDVVQCARGGYGSAQLIPHLDFDLIAANPKPFVGYSDITALHVALRQNAGLATFYGYGLHGVGDPETTSFTLERLLAVLGGETTGAVPREPRRPLRPGDHAGQGDSAARRRVLLAPDADHGHAVGVRRRRVHSLLRRHGRPAWYVDGFLVQLAQAGKLERRRRRRSGRDDQLRLAAPRLDDFPRVKSIEDVLEERLGPLGVPVIYNLPLGHGKHLATLPLGVTATLDADERTLTIDEPALEA